MFSRSCGSGAPDHRCHSDLSQCPWSRAMVCGWPRPISWGRVESSGGTQPTMAHPFLTGTVCHRIGSGGVHAMGSLPPQCPDMRECRSDRLCGGANECPVSGARRTCPDLWVCLLPGSGRAVPATGMALIRCEDSRSAYGRRYCRNPHRSVSHLHRTFYRQEDLLVVHRSSHRDLRSIRHSCYQHAIFVGSNPIFGAIRRTVGT